MVNFYPFWEGVIIDDAPNRLFQNYLNVKLSANNKPIWVSETGWPSAGQTVINAVPSLTNAAEFFRRFASWARSNNVPFFYFDAYDEVWKQSEGLVGSNWGIWQTNAILKTGMQQPFDNQFSPTNWNAIINGAGTPSISFSNVPILGSGETTVSGVVSHVAPFNVFVSLYIRVSGRWYENPQRLPPVRPRRCRAVPQSRLWSARDQGLAWHF